MASIPLPALGLHPVEQPDIGASVGRMMQIGIAIQQQQQQLADQKAMTAAFKDWDGKDPQELIKGVIGKGGSAQAVVGLQSHLLQQKEMYSKIAADDATTGQKNLETAKGKADAVLGAINGLKALPDEQLPAAVAQKVQEMTQQGLIDPKAAGSLGQLVQGDPASIRAHLDSFAKINSFQSQQMEAAQKQAETDKAKAETNKLNLEANPDNPANPNFQKQKYQNILRALQTGQQVPAQDAAWAKSYELSERKTTTASDSLGVTSSNTSGPSGLSAVRGNGGGGAGAGTGTGPQGLKDSMVDMVGQYKLNPTMLQRMMVKHPEIIAAVSQKYPDWNQTDYNAKNKMLESYTSGPESRSINAVNTALGHLGELNEALKATSQNNVPLLNSIANKLGAAVGKDAATTYTAILHRVSPELTSAYVQGGGGEAERGANQQDFELSKGTQQVGSNIAESAKLLRSKISAQENQWNNTFKPTKDSDKFENRFITPQAKATLDSLSSKSPVGGAASGMVRIKASDGSLHDIPAGNLDKAKQIDPKLQVVQ